MAGERQGISVQTRRAGRGQIRQSGYLGLGALQASCPEYDRREGEGGRVNDVKDIIIIGENNLGSSTGLDEDDFTFLQQFNFVITQG